LLIDLVVYVHFPVFWRIVSILTSYHPLAWNILTI